MADPMTDFRRYPNRIEPGQSMRSRDSCADSTPGLRGRDDPGSIDSRSPVVNSEKFNGVPDGGRRGCTGDGCRATDTRLERRSTVRAHHPAQLGSPSPPATTPPDTSPRLRPPAPAWSLASNSIPSLRHTLTVLSWFIIHTTY